jgi:hypothetical protein
MRKRDISQVIAQSVNAFSKQDAPQQQVTPMVVESQSLHAVVSLSQNPANAVQYVERALL